MDLNAPLGMNPRPKPRRRFALVAAAVLGGMALAAIGLLLATADPHGGEPYVVAAIPPVAPKAPTTPLGVDPIRTGSVSAAGTAPSDGGHIENGVKVFRAARPAEPASTATGPLIIDVTKVLDDPRRRAAPDVAGGAPNVSAAVASPRVAIFVGGMGLSQTATRTAIETMPAAVSLAFVPYGATVAASVAAARAKGHEVLLQVPMQTGQGATPGPHALRPNASAVATADDLAWLMGRFDGYDGLTNLLGAPVTGSLPAMTALLKAVGARGLFYLDDGTSKRSLGPSLGVDLGVRVARADVVLDATADPAVVRANLDALAAIARRKGSAIGMASGLPDHLAAIARFAAELGARGITLVPVNALVARDANLAVNR